MAAGLTWSPKRLMASGINLFEPAGDRLKATRLVSMKDHDYGLEPNVHFSPDQKYIIFRSNMKGRLPDNML